MAARRARILTLAVLGLLEDTPMHGYELRKRLNTELGMFRAFSYGSLYPCLKDLLGHGLIEECEPPQQAPAPARRDRRSRISYRLTAAGSQLLQQMLAETSAAVNDGESFGVHLAFFSSTRADIRLRILEGRRELLQRRLEHYRSYPCHPRQRVDRYTSELHRYGAEAVEREVRWISGLIQQERGQAPSALGPA